MAMTRVLEQLYLGDARDADHLSVSNPFGITAVVNVNTAPNDSKRDGINYVHFPLGESCKVPPLRLEQVITTIGELIRTRKVLIHCAAGSSRSPVVVALYMDIVGCKNFDDALSQLRELRPVVAPSKLIIDSARAYLKEMT
jgi:atypical dual specificity phosphatase